MKNYNMYSSNKLDGWFFFLLEKNKNIFQFFWTWRYLKNKKTKLDTKLVKNATALGKALKYKVI